MIWKAVAGFLLKRWFQIVIIGGAMAILGGAFATGYRTAWKQAEVDTLKATIAARERDLAAAAKQQESTTKVIARLEAQALADEAENDALECLLASRPAVAPRGLTQSELDLLLGRRAPQGEHANAERDAAVGPCVSPAGAGENAGGG